MSIKRNILAGYVGQIYATLFGILLVPLYGEYMGAEAYGLVRFFTMLQGWFMLLDMGLSPTTGRSLRIRQITAGSCFLRLRKNLLFNTHF